MSNSFFGERKPKRSFSPSRGDALYERRRATSAPGTLKLELIYSPRRSALVFTHALDAVPSG
jgi:hypothetical protein